MRNSVERAAVVIAAIVLAVLHAGPAAAEPLSQPTYQPTLTRGVEIPMRDGVALVANILMPTPEGRFPVVLVRTPYGRDLEANWVERGMFFATRGYAVVVQSVRGREDSGGDWQPWMAERRDGYDTIDWIARQPWSDGNVGMIGGSYLGSVQLQAAAEAPPALKCIIPYIAGTDLFFQVPFDHGIFNLELVQWLYFNSGASRVLDERMPPRTNPDRLSTLPLNKADDAWAGKNLPIFDSWLAQDRPSQFAGGNFLADLAASNPRLPILHLSGWWDGALGGVQRNWAELSKAPGHRQWLVLGFWPHTYSQWAGRETRHSDRDYGAASQFDFQTLYLRWFDTWLKGRSVGMDAVPRVQTFMTGANEWRSFEAWNPAQVRETLFYLGPAQGKAKGMGNLSLSQPGAAGPPLSFAYDPSKASARRDINFLESTKLWFSPADGDSLLFQTEPLPATMDVAGQVELDLHFSSSAADTDFFALLVDIDAQGQRRAVTLPGKMRARYFGGWEDPRALEPGRVYNIRIQLAGRRSSLRKRAQDRTSDQE